MPSTSQAIRLNPRQTQSQGLRGGADVKMPATEYQGSIASLGHSILSIRHDQVHNMDGNNEASAQEGELESF
ncbi:hypothetical protein IFM89_029449 [Coptis chinensis]|uniref:Uncharacterized protein n=1 Tax=Coptis chinensis TaxID=261450 RepID=A0A835LTD5_9MAGN|nr:hypothetical protein IFM89_029449 [Coptis chinensis]